MWSDGYRDPEAARVELGLLVDRIAGEKGWTADQVTIAKADIAAAYQAADDAGTGLFGYGVDVRTLWSDLARRVTDGRYRDFPNGDKYAATVLSGVQAVDGEQYAAYMASWKSFFPEVVAPALVESATDLRTAGETVGTAATNPWILWGGVALVALLVLRR